MGASGFRWVVAFLFALSWVGCGPPYRVVQQVQPNPFVHATRFGVAPMIVADLFIAGAPVRPMLSDPAKGPALRDYFERLSGETVRELAERSSDTIHVPSRPGPGVFLLRVRLRALELRMLIIQANFRDKPAGTLARLTFDLELLSPRGEVLDIVTMRMPEMNSGGRSPSPDLERLLPMLATEIAGRTMTYLRDRTRPPG